MFRAAPLFLLAVLALSPRCEAREVRIAVLAFQGSERAVRDFEPPAASLNPARPDHSVTLIPHDLDGLHRAAEQQTVDFIITNPGDYVGLEARFGVTRLATLESRGHAVPTDTVGSTLVTLNRPGHPRTLSDLSGKRVAIVARDAFGGWQTIWREMDDAGLWRLPHLIETGVPMERVADALRAGRADAGVLRACLLEEMIADGRAGADEFAVAGERPAAGFPCRLSSRLYPDWPFARLAGTAPDLAKAVTASLLTMPPVDGRAWTAPQDYSSVHALFRGLRTGPYAYLAHTTLLGFLAAYWQWLLAAGLGIVWWVAHVARVETLVHRRTAELRREIQEREKAEKAARLHREQRDQFSRLGILGEMASNIAHELNQPLAAITNYAEGLTRFIDSGRTDPSFLRDGARGIAGQAERAGAIIRRIRGFVRRREAQRAAIGINEVVRETLALFAGPAERSGVPLHLALADGLPPIEADPIEIEQILLNLLQNAMDAMENSPQRGQGIAIATRRAGETVEVAVRDHGTGLTPDVETHLFDTFFTTKPQGLGLGLSICRTIVENHGGRLWAENAPDGGLTMRFTLPVPPAEAS